MSIKHPHLVILPTIKAMLNPAHPDSVVLTGKFLTGMLAYAQQWPGQMTLLIEGTTGKDTNLDHQMVKLADLPYTLKIVNFEDPKLLDDLALADVALASVYWRQNHISRLCQQVNVPCVYVSEYAFETRLQMEKARAKNLLVYLRRVIWHWKQERQHRKALILADGLQANGTPTYNDYLGLAKHSLLYFDSRVGRSQMATQKQIDQRYRDLYTDRPLRLAFTGRLIAIKGVDHLPWIAKALDEMGVPFEMDICGGGDLEADMLKQINTFGLADRVRLLGVLDFHKQLVPMVKQSVDVFVCTHRQGDPSCTYLETMSCGVPIVGYDNSAFTGVCEHANAGWVTPMDQPQQLARQIAMLHQRREEIHDHATRSLAFAMNHSFEDTFKRRVDHLIQLSRHSMDVQEQTNTSQSTLTTTQGKVTAK